MGRRTNVRIEEFMHRTRLANQSIKEVKKNTHKLIIFIKKLFLCSKICTCKSFPICFYYHNFYQTINASVGDPVKYFWVIKLITGPLYFCFRSTVTKRKNFTWDSSMALLSPTCFIRWSRHILEFDFNATNFVHKRTYKMKIYGIFGCKFIITILTTYYSLDHHPLFFTGLPLFRFSSSGTEIALSGTL